MGSGRYRHDPGLRDRRVRGGGLAPRIAGEAADLGNLRNRARLADDRQAVSRRECERDAAHDFADRVVAVLEADAEVLDPQQVPDRHGRRCDAPTSRRLSADRLRALRPSRCA